jgi:hypothetical protein
VPRRLIIPQLLSSNRGERISFQTIRRLAFDQWTPFARDLVVRREVFIDAEKCSDHVHAKAYIARIAADRIISRLQETSPSERWREFMKITIPIDHSVNTDVLRRVKEQVQV